MIKTTTGKEQFDFLLINSEEFPINYKNLEEYGYGNLVAFLTNLDENTVVELQIPIHADAMYYFIFKNMKPEKALKLAVLRKINSEYIIESSHITEWLLQIDRNKAEQILAECEDCDSIVLVNILSNLNFNHTEVVSYLENQDKIKKFGEPSDDQAECILWLMQKRNMSRNECIEIFNNCTEDMRRDFFYDENNNEITYFTKILCAEKIIEN